MNNKLWKVRRKKTIWEEVNVVAETKVEAFELIKAFPDKSWNEAEKIIDYSLNHLRIVERDVEVGNV